MLALDSCFLTPDTSLLTPVFSKFGKSHFTNFRIATEILVAKTSETRTPDT